MPLKDIHLRSKVFITKLLPYLEGTRYFRSGQPIRAKENCD